MMKIYKIMVVLAAVAFFFTSACAETSVSYYMEVKPGTGDYVTVVCAPKGNTLGFSLEFPRCYCNGGIKLTYVVESRDINGSGYNTRFELRRGYLLENAMETLIVSLDGRTIERMIVGDKKISQRNDPEMWQGNTEAFANLMTTFGPRFYEIEALCRSKQGGHLPLTMNLQIASSSVPWSY
jgi:hypothetical protein